MKNSTSEFHLIKHLKTAQAIESKVIFGKFVDFHPTPQNQDKKHAEPFKRPTRLWKCYLVLRHRIQKIIDSRAVLIDSGGILGDSLMSVCMEPVNNR